MMPTWMMGVEVLTTYRCPDCGTPATAYTLLLDEGQPSALRFVCANWHQEQEEFHRWRVRLGECAGVGRG